MPEDPKSTEGTTEDEEVAESRDTGGDAPAAASIAEREAVARGDDNLFEGDDGGDDGSDQQDEAGGTKSDA